MEFLLGFLSGVFWMTIFWSAFIVYAYYKGIIIYNGD